MTHQVRNTPLISPDGPMNGTSGEMTGIRRAGIGLFVAQIVSWRTPGAGNAVNYARRVFCDILGAWNAVNDARRVLCDTLGAGNAVNDARRVLCDTHRVGYERKRG